MFPEAEARDDGRPQPDTEERPASRLPSLPRRRGATGGSIAEAALDGASGRSRDGGESGSGTSAEESAPGAGTAAGTAEPDAAIASLAAEIPWTRAPWAVDEETGTRGRWQRAARAARAGGSGAGGSSDAVGSGGPDRGGSAPGSGPEFSLFGRPDGTGGSGRDGHDSDGEEGDGEEGGGRRRRKRVMAAVALTGVVLLGVPLLLMNTGGDEDRATATAASEVSPVGDDDYFDGGQPAGDEPDATAGPAADESPDADERGGAKKAAPGTDTQAGDAGAADGTSEDGGTGRTAAEEKAAAAAAHDPAPAEDSGDAASGETTTRRVRNAHSGKCLAVGAERVVVQDTCGTGGWQRQPAGDGVFLLRSTSASMCLDTDGESMYVSPCTTEDPGQLWRVPDAGGCAVTLTSKTFGKYVTGWNTGSVALVAAGDVDEAAKYTWSTSPSPVAGC
ncbi:RICIN domain-containing protein [Streptomyces sp. NBC_00102]|uniref:RICIN domain-containing protein n=1 Tax=Streptomyces sp. NBC_00102 TaxID=2975652 RepID=UPI00225B5FFA|nr:hypothetical protein [Streptomyces sp. NBC_00102]MCX5400479.1 RICIN domain-containing protein [Streptomyces sp. NBC_00102]